MAKKKYRLCAMIGCKHMAPKKKMFCRRHGFDGVNVASYHKRYLRALEKFPRREMVTIIAPGHRIGKTAETFRRFTKFLDDGSICIVSSAGRMKKLEKKIVPNGTRVIAHDEVCDYPIEHKMHAVSTRSIPGWPRESKFPGQVKIPIDSNVEKEELRAEIRANIAVLGLTVSEKTFEKIATEMWDEIQQFRRIARQLGKAAAESVDRDLYAIFKNEGGEFSAEGGLIGNSD